MNEPSIYVCRVGTPEGMKDYVTLVPSEVAFAKGLVSEAVVGVVLRQLTVGETITPDVFVYNGVFVRFMHDVIARHGPSQPSCQSEAKRLGNGWVYVIDGRTKSAEGPVPTEDIIGAFRAKDGDIVRGSYQASSNHMILSAHGFFQLPTDLQQCLLRELESICTGR